MDVVIVVLLKYCDYGIYEKIYQDVKRGEPVWLK
jgi:hypothetical protein